MSTVRALLRKVLRRSPRAEQAVRQVRQAVRLAVDGPRETFYPEAAQKTLARRLGDQALHLVQHGEADTSYYVFAHDLVANPRPIAYPAFRKIRDRRNLERSGGRYSYACLVRDKRLFEVVARSFGYPTPRTLAELSRDGVRWADEREMRPIGTLLEKDFDGFAKRVDGEGGKGAFAVRSRGGELEIDGEAATPDDVRRRIGQPYVLQERVVQHADLARLHPASLNTFRIMTVLEAGGARAFATILRIGAGNSVQDNASSGGVSVLVDPETGKTTGKGFVRLASVGWVDHHPDTGVRLDGIDVPFVAECVDMACRFHEDLPHFYTLGWDLAMSPDGPLVIECNDNWGSRILAPLVPDFWRTFRELYDLDAVS